MKKLSFLLILPLLASSPACGQQKPSQAQTPPAAGSQPVQAQPAQAPAGAPAQPAAPAAPTDPLMNEALKKVEAGDVAGAVQMLESRRNELKVPALSLLGALYLQANRPQDALAVLKPLADLEGANPAVLYNASRAAAAVGQNENARTYLIRAALQAPASPAARDLGFAMMREGKVVEAYGLLVPWVLRNPQDGDARLMAASLALVLERPDEAEGLLAGLPADDPAIRLMRGRALAQKGNGKEAVALLKPLLDKHPQGMDLEVRRALAEAYLAAGEPAQTLQLLQGHTGNHPGLVLLLGRAQRRSGNATAAMATLKPLADQIPADPAKISDPRPAVGIAIEYGSLLIEAGRAKEAVPYLEKATTLHPQGQEGWKTLAQALDAAGRKDDAQKARAKAAEIAQAAARPAAPPPPPAPAQGSAPQQGAPAQPVMSEHMQEAMRMMAQGQSQKALEAVQREIKAVPSDLRPRVIEVQLLLVLQHPAEALQAAEAALQLQPNNPDLIYQRGVVQMARKDMAAAEKDLRRALEIAPRHTAAMNDLAVLLMSTGRAPEAKPLLEQALKINPQDQMASRNLEQLRQMQGGGGQ
jgi:tetratricopeptide (TPR) repeat protein